MKAVVFSCNTGGGHNSCARYIKEEFNASNIPCDVVDYMTIIGPKASKRAETIYLGSTRGEGNIFGSVYHLGELYNKTGVLSPVYGLNALVKKKLYNFIVDNNYDILITTHLFPSLALTSLKKEHDIRFINVATDYECIPFWNETNPDTFVIPSSLLIDRFVEKGIKREIILATGIPVSSKFLDTKNLKLPSDKSIVLLTSGSMGFGNIEEITSQILEEIDCYLIVICGNNKKAVESLEKIKNDNLKVLGFVNNMNDYIASSDLVVTKPGGITITEVSILNKPMILMMPIPGVESYNAKFFEKNDIALKVDNVEELVNAIKRVLSEKKLRNTLVKNETKYLNRYSARDLIDYIKEEYIK